MRSAVYLRTIRVRTLGAVALCAAVLLGCGEGAHKPPGGSHTREADYRWLVPTAGEPPTIAVENERPGTTAWRLPGPPGLLGGAAHGRLPDP